MIFFLAMTCAFFCAFALFGEEITRALVLGRMTIALLFMLTGLRVLQLLDVPYLPIPALVLVFGLISATTYIYALAWLHREHPSNTKRLGACVLGAAAGLYMTVTAIDHFWFFRGEPDRAGWVSSEAVEAADVPCIRGLAIVRLDEDGAQFRCPRSFVFDTMSSRPFIPWPGYDAGKSTELKMGIERMMKNTVQPDPQN